MITTGDAARKDNAEAIVRLFSERAGNFVCASAGPILEAKMAAYGSGAVIRSAYRGTPTTVLNIDVGGGTSKLAVVREGAIREVAAINVGARLITLDERNVVTRIEEAASVCSRHHDLGLQVGMPASEATITRLAEVLAECLMEVAAGKLPSALTSALMITEPLRFDGPVDVVLFSGGVSEYFYREAEGSFDDLGALLADQIRARTATFLSSATVELPKERIRATVIGASQFTVQISGNTIHLANPGLLPLRDLRAEMVDLDDVEVDGEGIARAIEDSLARFEVVEGEALVALAIHWPHVRHSRISRHSARALRRPCR